MQVVHEHKDSKGCKVQLSHFGKGWALLCRLFRYHFVCAYQEKERKETLFTKMEGSFSLTSDLLPNANIHLGDLTQMRLQSGGLIIKSPKISYTPS